MATDDKILQPSTFCLAASIFSAALCAFFNLRSSSQEIKNSFIQARDQDAYREALLLTIGVSIPLFADWIIAIYDFIAQAYQNDVLCLCARGILFFSVVIPDFICFSIQSQENVDASNTRMYKAFANFTAFKLVSIICSISTILCRKSRCMAKKASTAQVFFPGLSFDCHLLALVLVSLSFQSFTYAGTTESPLYSTISTGILCVMVMQIFWIFVKWAKDIRTSQDIDTKDNFIMATCLILLLLRCIAILLLIETESSFSNGYASIDWNGAAVDLYFQIAFMVGFLLVPWNVVKSKAFVQLQETLEEKSSFTRFISHEVRAPLNVAGLSLSFLKTEAINLNVSVAAQLLSPIMDAIVDVDRSCKAAVSILNDVLLFDKMKEGKLELELHSHHPLEIFREFHRQFGIVAKQNKVNFVFECRGEEDGWPQENSIYIDAVRFGQVLRNLLTNAFKFTPATGTVTIQVSCVEASNVEPNTKAQQSFTGLNMWDRLLGHKQVRNITPAEQSAKQKVLHVEVIDSGAGISKENQKKLFGQYVQFNANSLQKGGGSGLGLWISKGIMSNHAGKLWAESEGEGHGSRFIVEIPLLAGGVSLESEGDGAYIYDADCDMLLGSMRESDPGYLSSRRLAGSGHFSGHSAGSQQGLQSLKLATGWSLVGNRYSGSSGSGSGCCSGSGWASVKAQLSERIQEYPDLEAQIPRRRVGSFSTSEEVEEEQSSRLCKARFNPSFQADWSSLIGAFGPGMLPVQNFIAAITGGDEKQDEPTANGMPLMGLSGISASSIRIKGDTDSSSGNNSSRASGSHRSCASAGGRAVDPVGGGKVAETATCVESIADPAESDRGRARAHDPEWSFEYKDAHPAATLSVAMDANPGNLRKISKVPSSSNILAAVRKIPSASNLAAVGATTSLDVTAVMANSPPSVLTAGSQGKKGLRILVVDDAKVTRKMVGRVLIEQGHDVSFASDGEEFLIVMKGPSRSNGFKEKFADFDAVLVDRYMPSLRGPEATRLLRDKGYEGLLIGLTVDTGDEDIRYFKDHGANDVLHKPFKMRDFDRVIQEFAMRRQQRGKDSGKAPVAQRLSPQQQSTGEELEQKMPLQSGRHVLVVHDANSTRKVMGRFLMKKGHNVSFADDAEELLRKLQTSKAFVGSSKSTAAAPAAAVASFDAILVDRHLGKLGGPEAIRGLREKGYRGLIVGLKGDSGDEDVRKFNNFGADDVLPKPFNVDDLNELMRLFDERKRGGEGVAPPAAKAADRDSLAILVVDDSSSTRKVMSRLLATKGHRVSFAADGEEFLKVMQSTLKPLGRSSSPQAFAQFDVVLIDRHMPKMEGPEAIRRIRDLGYGGLIVGLTGDTGEHDVRHFKNHGADAVLPKPFNMDHLNEIVRDFTSRKPAGAAVAVAASAAAAAVKVAPLLGVSVGASLEASQRPGSKESQLREDQKVVGRSVGKKDNGKAPKVGGGLSVLVVDDSSSTRKVMGRLLSKKGHTVSFAEDGEEFMGVLEDRIGNPFDVVLIDRHMPKLDGPTATSLMRKKGYSGLIVGLTGDTGEEDVKHFKSHGADTVLPKPFNIDELDDIVKEFRNQAKDDKKHQLQQQAKKAPPKSLRVLVVDDSGSTRKVMGRVLMKKGHRVSFAVDGEEFIKIMCSPSKALMTAAAEVGGAFTVFDVVLVDRHMPKLEGPEATRRLRELGYRGLIVGLTGDTGDSDMLHFKVHGADAVLPKPLNIEDLDEVVRDFYAMN